MRACDSNAGILLKGDGGKEAGRSGKCGLTITCVKLLSGAVHVSIEDGGWSSRSCANGVIVPSSVRPRDSSFSSFSFSLPIHFSPFCFFFLFLFFSSPLLSVIIRFNGSDWVRNDFFLFFF